MSERADPLSEPYHIEKTVFTLAKTMDTSPFELRRLMAKRYLEEGDIDEETCAKIIEWLDIAEQVFEFDWLMTSDALRRFYEARDDQDE